MSTHTGIVSRRVWRLVGVVTVALSTGPFLTWPAVGGPLGGLGELGGAPAWAEEATGDEVSALARQAIVELDGDVVAESAALDTLRDLDTVDGRPVDLDASLDVADVDVLTQRLGHLARASGSDQANEGAVAHGTDPADAAADVLEGDRYHEREGFRPLRGLIDKIRDAFRTDRAPKGSDSDLGGTGDNDTDRAGDDGGMSIVGAIVALAILGAATAVVTLLVRRRARGRIDPDSPEGRAKKTSARADRLERDAEQARAQGDHDRAVRLRFQAGLLRLESVGALALRPGLTNRAAADALDAPSFDELARDFDAILYGHRPATEADSARAWELWPPLVDEERARARSQADSSGSATGEVTGSMTGVATGVATATGVPARPGSARQPIDPDRPLALTADRSDV